MRGSSIPDIDQLRNSLHVALRTWHSTEAKALVPLRRLEYFRAAGLGPNANYSFQERRIANSIIQNSLHELHEQHPLYAELLEQRFIQGKAILQVAYDFKLSEDQISRCQRGAIKELADLILQKELFMRAKRVQSLMGNLQPPSYTRLIGRSDLIEQLKSLLSKPNSPWVLEVVGIGGIGKTALVDAVVREIIPERIYREVYWIHGESIKSKSDKAQWKTLLRQLAPKHLKGSSIDRNIYGQIRSYLKEEPAVIVIDNLELDEEEYPWFDYIHDLANPSKFLITCRTHFKSLSASYQVPVSELRRNGVRQFLEHRAISYGKRNLANGFHEGADEIYSLVGGNPLFLNVVTDKLAILPLASVTRSLKTRPDGTIEETYRKIFQKSWLSLSSVSQYLLKSMLTISTEGGPFEKLMAISNLPVRDCTLAVEELVLHSLMESEGSFNNPSYRIHRLTATFLRSDLIDQL